MTRKSQDRKDDASTAPDTANSASKDRRRDERRPADKTPQISARLVGGTDVKLINLSRYGVLLETSMALRPGRSVSLRFIALDAELVLSGCVVRSSVGTLTSTSIAYQTAVTFNKENTLLTRVLEEEPVVLAPAPPADGLEAGEDLMLVVAVSGDAAGVRTMLGAA